MFFRMQSKVAPSPEFERTVSEKTFSGTLQTGERAGGWEPALEVSLDSAQDGSRNSFHDFSFAKAGSQNVSSPPRVQFGEGSEPEGQ